MADARLIIIVTHLLAAGVGYALAPREMLETEVTSTGFFTTDTKRVLAAAVESLRSANSMVVYSYKGSATVSAERDGILMFDGRADLIVPASVSYLLDLSQLSADSVTYDEAARVITVRLPRLTMSDVAFEPEGARILASGLLTFSQSQLEELVRANYATARRAVIKQAQGATLVDAAQRQARENIKAHFEVPLRIAGRPDLRVVARFDGG
jgi:hypothetical protein